MPPSGRLISALVFVLLVVAKSAGDEPYERISGVELDQEFYDENGVYIGEHPTFDGIHDDDIDYDHRFVSAYSQARKILKDHDKLDYSDGRKYSGITHAYVTPWNNHGYDVVKWAAKKFTHISPVWFQIRFEMTSDDVKCRVHGSHDIDREWMDDIRKNNSAIKFWPRFLFEVNIRNEQDRQSLQRFLDSETVQRTCAREIVDFCTRNGFDGIVLEIWLQIVGYVNKRGADLLMEFIEEFAKLSHSEDLTVVITLPPPLDYKRDEIKYLDAEQAARLAHTVDYLQIMTYDYHESGDAPTPVSPIDWAVDNMQFLVTTAGVEPSQLLMGMNWYGFRYDSSPGHIFGRDLVNYLTSDGRLEYDHKYKDFRVIFREDTAIAYYPTTGSIAYRIQKCEEIGLAGFSIWDVGQGLDHFTSVL